MGGLFNATRGTREGIRPGGELVHHATSYPKIRHRIEIPAHGLSLAKYFRVLAWERAELFDLTSPRAVTDELARIQPLECFLEHLVAIVLAWKQSQ